MSAIIGTALVAASLIGFAWAILAFRDPAGPAWREKYLVLEALACLIVGTFFFGLALLFQFTLQFAPPLNFALSIGVFALIWAMLVAIWRVMGVRAKVAEFERARAGAPKVPPAAITAPAAELRRSA
jgi:small-conductance mechanosensitive channel